MILRDVADEREPETGPLLFGGEERREDLVALGGRDAGPVVGDDEVQALIEPFRRRGTARTGPGHGLGLSIVAAVTAAHGGTLGLRARAGGGLSVTVSLPTVRESASAPVSA